MSRQAGWLAQIGLYDDCYALCLPLCLLGLGGPRWTLLSVEGVPLCWGSLCRSRLCVRSLAIGGMSIEGHSFFLLGTGDIPDSWFCVVGATGAAAHVPFVVSFVCEAVRGFPCFPCVFCPLLFFGSISLGFSSPLGSGGVGGHTTGRGLSRVGYIPRDVEEDLLCFLFFLLLQLATGSLEGLETGQEEVCLSCFCIPFWGFLFWHF